MKQLFIAEKPSVARQFADALGIRSSGGRNGFIEDERYIITWCVGHLIGLSYPEVYGERYRRWDFATLPFIPEVWRYEVIPGTENQFRIVSALMNRADVDVIYVCTDSAREGEYIYRLVEQEAHVSCDKTKKRVWIDSQTKEEILRGIREAKPDSDYDRLASAAFSRAKEDYLMGINFSRALSLKYSDRLRSDLNISRKDKMVVAVGRVMTCVLGMIVRREQEIRAFQKTSFFRIVGDFDGISAEWRPAPGGKTYPETMLYEGKGFLKREAAEQFAAGFSPLPREAVIAEVQQKKEVKNPPLLYNLAELQNDCSKLFKMNPDETLQAVQSLYEKRMTTYPRTDARVLSSAAAKEIGKNLQGLKEHAVFHAVFSNILEQGKYLSIGKTRYTDDKKISDHYAIIPTGQGLREYARLKPAEKQVYDLIVRRFAAIFLPPAVYKRVNIGIDCMNERFQASRRILQEPGYLSVPGTDKDKDKASSGDENASAEDLTRLLALKKGKKISLDALEIREGETSPPKRYTSGSMILAMENAGSLIEDEELRAQIKGVGIGTSATRAGILTKLTVNRYIALDKKTQILTPTKLGERIAYYVKLSVPHLLNPELTASWEKGLSKVEDGSLSEADYMHILEKFVREKTERIRQS